MQDSFVNYIVAIIAIVAAFFIIKKVASCLIRTIVFLIAAAIVAIALYMLYK